MKSLKNKVSGLALAVGLLVPAFAVSAAENATQDVPVTAQVAVAAPVFLQLEITSSCNDKGAAIRMINRGDKWPQLGQLKLYYADTREVISARKLRLASNQQVGFVINHEMMGNRPVAVWIEPSWYERAFKFDARISCK